MRNTIKQSKERITEINKQRDALICALYTAQYTITELGSSFNMSTSRIWQIVDKSKIKKGKE